MRPGQRVKGFWEIEENQRNFLLELGKKFNILKPADWGKITWRDVVKSGGTSILSKHGSLFNALQQNFKGFNEELPSR